MKIKVQFSCSRWIQPIVLVRSPLHLRGLIAGLRTQGHAHVLVRGQSLNLSLSSAVHPNPGPETHGVLPSRVFC